MPSQTELPNETVEDDFESCDEEEGEPLQPEHHAGQIHSLEPVADANCKSLKVAGQASVRQPGAHAGPSGPVETYSKLQSEERLSAVQFQFSQELSKRDQLLERLQQDMQRLRQDLQHERAQNASLTDRVTALEANQVKSSQLQEELRAQSEAFKASSKQVHSNLQQQLEANEIRERAPCLMMFGLAERHAMDGQALYGAVTQQLVDSAGPHGFTSSSVISASRIGRHDPDRSTPRPVLVRCSSVSNKHLAFRARRALRANSSITIDEYLTPAQLRSRASQQGEFDRLRQVPGANPHWRHGDVLYRWENNKAIPHVPPPPSASPSPQPAASTRGSRRPSRGAPASRGAGVARSAARAAGASASTPRTPASPSRPRA